MKIASDKIQHMKAGAVAAILGAILGILVALVMMAAIVVDDRGAMAASYVGAAVGALACSLAAGLTKEFADYQDNKTHPGMHGVESWDAAATALPGFVLAGLLMLMAGKALGAL